MPVNVRQSARSETARSTVRSTVRSTARSTELPTFQTPQNRPVFEEYITWDTPDYRVFLVPESEIIELGKEAWLDRRRKHQELKESCKELFEQRNREYHAVPQSARRAVQTSASAGRYTYGSDLKPRNTPVTVRTKHNYGMTSHARQNDNSHKTATASTGRRQGYDSRLNERLRANPFW
ncbi:hypothetical protein BO78DRAFT_423857 [Aspergillus sclerotiicarbonarius CBS 121057]|uniref:Uncharacterized protein n=1 Tax=Aspergillus sclerotiicarbonarius (strain CBS 121057 / IBT 28362) TaxID=1448318 RepID=A0A319DTV9_ASPSB|nr:hypothetical protein BO78DRAFT_423857 [Aspergillus sclerotiicarbonarius CBS 121057]